MSVGGKGVRYVLRRLALAVPTVLTIVVLNFALLHLAPGDAADVLAGEAGSATPEYMAQLRQKFGLDQPLHVQLFAYMARVFTLDLGYSFRHGMGVAELIAHEVTGLLARQGDIADLAHQISRLVEDPALAAKLASNARDWILTTATLERQADAHVAVLREVIGRRGRDRRQPRPA